MPSDEQGVSERKIELNLFGQVEGCCKPRKKQPSIGFLLGPKEKPKRIVIEEDGGELADQLHWAKLVDDRPQLK